MQRDPAPPSAVTWSAFRRRDLSALTRIVRDVAESADPGVHGHGVEVVVESPPRRWWGRMFDRTPRDRARIAVTGAGGATGYPIHVRLTTGFGATATQHVDRRDRWATSVTAITAVTPPDHGHPAGGEAILMLKRGTIQGYAPDDAASEVASGTVAALTDLHPFTPDRGWRVAVDRNVLRH